VKRAEIKVGEVYGVRYGRISAYGGTATVPARVVSLDASCTVVTSQYARSPDTLRGGGVEVEFLKPTRVGNYYSGFSLAADANENAGPITKTFVFHDKRYGCNGSVGKCFVGLWADLEKDRKEEARAVREQSQQAKARAEAFKPVLAGYVERLQKLGLPVELYDDGSGLHGAVDVDLYSGEHGPTSLGYEAQMPRTIFDQLVEIAERHGEKIDLGREEDDE
jgi:hypothetical protein